MLDSLSSKHLTHQVHVGHVIIGGGAPIVIQSMTNTDTADVEKTFHQIKQLHQTGSEIVRITVNNAAAAKAVAEIKNRLEQAQINVPLVGCFHYNGHKLLQDFPSCAQTLDKYRINPGNVGFGNKKDAQFQMMIEAAIQYNKAVRIGVNWGSLDQKILAKLMDANSASSAPKSSDEVIQLALVESALSSAAFAESIGLPSNKIILSAKVSRVQDLIKVYQLLANQSKYALHLGLTEAGLGNKGIIATTSALAILLQQGIGDTIRASLTPQVDQPRSLEVTVCQEILQALGLRNFKPQVIACPGCGRTTSSFFQKLAHDVQIYIEEEINLWQSIYPGVENLNIAVMGCVVNGPGESKHADIGISLPGTGESPIAPVFVDGKKTYTLKGEDIAEQFKHILTHYIEQKFSSHSKILLKNY